jgi:hypothetical protein
LGPGLRRRSLPRPTPGLGPRLGLGRWSSPRPTPGPGLNLDLGRWSRPRPTLGLGPRLGRWSPPRPTPGHSLNLDLGRWSPPRPTQGLGLNLDLGRNRVLARPWPRPQEESPPRPTLGSDRPRHRGYIITLSLARDVSKVPAAPTAVLLQGSSAPPTATTPRAQGSSTSPTTMLACTQGSGTSLPDTLAHNYTPIVHLDLLLASIKGRSRALMREGRRAGGWADEPARSLSLSPSRTLVTPTASASPFGAG